MTQSKLKSILHYNPVTGIFTRKDNTKCGSFSHGYIRIVINKKRYYAHRLAWLYVYGEFPTKHIDHINHKGTDNRIKNIREVGCIDNHKNLPKYKNNKSGISGIFYNKKHKRWCPQIAVNGNKKHLGSFKTLDEAVLVRSEALNKHGYHNNHGK